jgi:hypothetical protein
LPAGSMSLTSELPTRTTSAARRSIVCMATSKMRRSGFRTRAALLRAAEARLRADF